MDQRPSFVVLDFGSQTTQLICRRLRDLNVHADLMPAHTKATELKKWPLKGIILSGGPSSVYDDGAPQIDPEIFNLNIPILGICYGLHLTSKTLKGRVVPTVSREFGSAQLVINEVTPLFDGVDSNCTVWMSHGDHLEELPDGFEIIASTESCPIASCYHRERKIYGVQFHPEVTHTQYGKKILENFTFNICQAEKDWFIEDYVSLAASQIKEQVGDSLVICGLSGGVDSSVLAALLHEAIGDQLICVFVDHGLLRLNEREQVIDTFQNHLNIELVVKDASELFFKELKNIDDPEQKRKIIGKLFIDVFQHEANQLNDVRFLAQGTIYSDVIESAGTKTKHASQIKSHHNVGGLPESLGFELVEPLNLLFKDEVRQLGLKLGLPSHMIDRHPFPGPGLAVRILGAVDRESADILRQADAIFIEELRSSGWYQKSFQAFAVLLPVRSTGVMGDARTYEKVCALRCVTSEDVMTADWTRIPYEVLAQISNRIINEVKGVNRVVYDISSKPPATIEWE